MTLMSLENITLSESRQTQEARQSVIPLTGNIRNRHINKDRKEICGCLQLRRGGWGVTAWWVQGFFWG